MAQFSDVEEVLAQMPVCVAAYDRAGRFAWVSSAGYGREAEDVLGTAGLDLVLGEDRPAWSEAFARALHGREVVRYAARFSVPEPPGVVSVTGTLSPVVIRGAVRYVCSVNSHAPLRRGREGAAAGVAPYSRLAAKLLGVLAGNSWLATPALARMAGVEASTEVRAVLRDLADRGAVETNQRLGVRLTDAGRASLGDS